MDVDDSRFLDQCPFCSYSLATLPAEHRCPECGQDVDRRWRLFGGVSRWHSLSGLRRLGTLGFLILVGCVTAWMTTVVDPCGLLIPVVFVIYLVRSVFSRPPVFIAVGPGGVTVWNRKSRTRDHYAWDRVGAGRLGGRTGMKLMIDGRSVEVDGWRGNVAEAERCAEHINECKRAHVNPVSGKVPG